MVPGWDRDNICGRDCLSIKYNHVAMRCDRPFINLKLVGTLTKEQKEAIAKEFSDTLLKVAGKPKESTHLVIDEVKGENWAQGEKFFG